VKILYLAHRIPYPPNKGDKIRSFHELKYLSGLGEVYLAALVDNLDDLKYKNTLRQWCRSVSLVTLSPRKKKILSLKGLCDGTSMSVQYFYEPDLQQAVDDLFIKHQFDVVYCFSSPMAEYVFRSNAWCSAQKSGRPVSIMDFCDVDSQKWKQYSNYAKWPLSSIYRKEGRLLQRYERRVAEAFQYSIFASKGERALFNRLNPTVGTVLSMSNGVDLEYFSSFDGEVEGTSPVIVFTGAMDYYANVDGVCWFAEHVWPIILKAVPDTKFIIVGANPSSEVRRLHNDKNIEVTGFVSDIRPYYRRASVSVTPLRIARGIQNKVLEAMAMGKAVVCTSNAFEGITAEPGKDLIVQDNETAFAQSLINLLTHKKSRESLGRCARKCVETYYRWEDNLSLLKRILTADQHNVFPVDYE